MPRPVHQQAGPYESILGEAFALLHPSVQRAHQPPLAATGSLDVEHGRHWVTPLMVRALKLPRAGRGQAVRLDVAADGSDIEWMRQIGSSVLCTRQRAAGLHLLERSGFGSVSFALGVDDGALQYRQESMHVLGVRIPAFLSPRVTASVAPAGCGWLVSVTVTWREHLICRYAGIITPL